MVGLKAEKINEDIAKQNKINKAFDFANNCCDKEIDRFGLVDFIFGDLL